LDLSLRCYRFIAATLLNFIPFALILYPILLRRSEGVNGEPLWLACADRVHGMGSDL
jgi:hypothetical protein